MPGRKRDNRWVGQLQGEQSQNERSKAGVLPTLGLLGSSSREGLIAALIPLRNFEVLNTVTYPHVSLKSPLSWYHGKKP